MNQLRKFFVLALLATTFFAIVRSDELSDDDLDPFASKNYQFEGLDTKLKNALMSVLDEVRPKIVNEIENYQSKLGKKVSDRRSNLQKFVMDELVSEVKKFGLDLKNTAVSASEISDASKLAVKVDKFAETVQNNLVPKVIARLDETKDSLVDNLPVANKEITSASGRLRNLLASSLKKNLGKFVVLQPKDIPQTLERVILPRLEKEVKDYYQQSKDKYVKEIQKKTQGVLKNVDAKGLADIEKKVEQFVEKKKNEAFDYLSNLITSYYPFNKPGSLTEDQDDMNLNSLFGPNQEY